MKKLSIILSILLLSISCSKIEPIENVHNAIVVQRRYVNGRSYQIIELKRLKAVQHYNASKDYKVYEFKKIKVHNYDFKRIRVNDTLK